MCFLSKRYMLMHEPVIYKYYRMCSNEHTSFGVSDLRDLYSPVCRNSTIATLTVFLA